MSLLENILVYSWIGWRLRASAPLPDAMHVYFRSCVVRASQSFAEGSRSINVSCAGAGLHHYKQLASPSLCPKLMGEWSLEYTGAYSTLARFVLFFICCFYLLISSITDCWVDIPPKLAMRTVSVMVPCRQDVPLDREKKSANVEEGDIGHSETAPRVCVLGHPSLRDEDASGICDIRTVVMLEDT